MYDVVPDFGSIYDAVPLYAARTDVLFYVGEAEKVQGSVLELGCGTGRVLVPLARAGHTIAGLDGSPQMLARCKAKLREEPKAVRERVSGSSGGTPKRHVQSFDMRWYVRAELVHLLARSGFRVDTIYGDFDGSPLTDKSPEQIACATRQ